MKKVLFGMLFLIVLIGAAGCAETSLPEADCDEESAKVEPAPVIPVAANASTAPTPVDSPEPETEFPEPPPHKIKLLMSGDFHGEDVEFKTGTIKNWIGLYRRKNKYFLLPTRVKIKAARDWMASEDSDDKSGKKVSSDYKLPDVFLLKNAKMLRAGEVKTLFYGNESDGINRKYRRQFEFNEKKYTLAVEDPVQNGEEWLTKNSKMVLTAGSLKQTIYAPQFCDDCGWDLCWVGDLDRDGKLDFFLNLTNHYNSTVHRLFLSSQAGKGEIVREVATFGTVGC